MTRFLALVLLLAWGQGWAVDLNIGGVGDGTTDETSVVQAALTDCSTNSKTCVVEAGKTYKVTSALYMWGAANLRGADPTSTIAFALGAEKYAVRTGLSANLTAATAWSGTMSNLRLVMTSGTVLGRLIWLARTSGATITGVSFYPGNLRYSLTGSGVDGTYLVGAGNYIRSNLTITNNVIYGTADNLGSEGIGLEGFSTARIARNTVSGVGDDLIGIHLESNNITIEENTLSGVDGRVYISNSYDVTVRRNVISREASRINGQWYAASALLYIGHETAATNSNTAPKRISVYSNIFIYPAGARDSAAAIYMQGPRDTNIYNNSVFNFSSTLTGRCTYQVPFDFTGTWTDPDGLDTTPAKVRNLYIANNRCGGAYPQTMIMTGPGANHIAPITIVNNSAAGTSYYAPASVSGTLTETAMAAASTISVQGAKILSTSPLKCAGTPVGRITDYFGRGMEPGCYPIGAAVYGAGDARATPLSARVTPLGAAP